MMRRLLLAMLTLQAPFTSESRLVVLPVHVIDDDGRPVAGLSAGDFRVYDEGRLTAIGLFDTGAASGSIGLLVDHSQSMQPHQAALSAAVRAFTSASLAGDELFALTFNEQVDDERYDGRLFAPAERVFPRGLTATPPAGRTALYDAIDAGLDRLAQGTFNKRALVVITDGGDTASRLELRAVTRSARRSAAVLHIVGLPSADWSRDTRRALERLASDTGGTMSVARGDDDLAAMLARLARDLQVQYTIGIAAAAGPGADTARRLSVTATRNGKRLRVTVRSSYVP
jgi:Ca-activated chloride channel family protein